jgi:hypothetical protein
MNYAQAKTMIADRFPDLILDPEVTGQPHICVRGRKNGPPFSVMLPETTDDPTVDAAVLAASLGAAEKHLLGKDA